MRQIFQPIVVMLVLAMPQSVKAEVSTSDLSGEWKSGALIAFGALPQNEKCRAFRFQERTLHLERVPGKPDVMRGQWLSGLSDSWIASDGGKCRRGTEESFTPILSAAISFAIDGTLDRQTGRLAIAGTYEGCQGNGCSILVNDAQKKAFHTELAYIGGAIVDTDPALNSQVKFIRTSEAVDREEAARQAAIHAINLAETGKFDSYFNEVWTTNMTPAERAHITEWFKSAVTMRGETVSRIPVGTLYAESMDRTKPVGDYVLLISDVKSAKNVVAREIVVMGMQNGNWKVIWVEYVS